MSLLREIQQALTTERSELGPILLKLRLLSSKLGLPSLDKWVRYETEGYPAGEQLPGYRQLPIAYTATFSGPFGSGINNAPIPTYLIEKHAGESWTEFNLRQSIASIDELIATSAEGGSLQIDASNLALLLQGNVYSGYACNAVYGHLSKSALVEVQNSVRSKILELTIQMEASSPEAAAVALDGRIDGGRIQGIREVSGSITQIIYGNSTTVGTSGTGNAVNVTVSSGDESSVEKSLMNAGIPDDDASAFATILASETPSDGAFGTKAKKWVSENLPKALSGSWKIGISAASKVLEEAALQYYGLK